MRKGPLEVGVFRDKDPAAPCLGGGCLEEGRAVGAPTSEEMSWILVVVLQIREREIVMAYMPRFSCPPQPSRGISVLVIFT